MLPEDAERPTRILSAVCAILGVIHLVNSDGKVDWIIIALLVICFIPWMSEVFESIGLKEGIIKYRARSGKAEAIPEPTEKQKQSPFYQLPSDARRVLATLWQKQNECFPHFTNERWTFIDPPGTPTFPYFQRGVSELIAKNYAAINHPNGHVMLTDAGIGFCREHSAEINSYPDIYGSFKPA